MSFYQDEFAGRIATKVMQTALAVRDTWLIVAELLVFVVIYFVTMLAVLGGFDARLLVPFLVWVALYIVALRVLRAAARPRRARAGRRALADDRPHHRRVHQHRDGEALLARAARGGLRARGDAGVPRHRARADAARHRLRDRQPRAVDGADRRAPPASTLWLWTQGEVGVGAVAAATAMALRLNGISHWVMWEMAALFEHIGTVQDGINTLARAAHGGRRARREAAGRDARRDPLRARELRATAASAT